MRTRPAPEISDCLPVWLACCCLLACFARSSEGCAGLAGWRACCLLIWRRGWASQAHMLMLAHVVASSQSESIVLCGFLVVYVAMPAPRPSSQAADLRSDAFERPPPLSAPDAGLLGGLRRGVPSERESSTGSWSSSGCVGSNMRRSTFRIHVSAFRLSLTCRMSRCVAPRPTRSPLEWVCNDALVSGLD